MSVAYVDAPIVTLLGADAAVAALVGARIYNDVAPSNTAFPVVVVSSYFVSSVETFDGPSGMEKHRVQVDAYARTRTAANQIVAAATAVLCRRSPGEGYSRTSNGVVIHAAFQVGSGSPPTYESDTELYRRTQDFFVTASAA